ncbi:MAG: thiamine pyrophosphate-binding protein [Pseudonocardia sp.]|nr:thiamine pyrophosphate-binding protein [Pseudonocardia sp.]
MAWEEGMMGKPPAASTATVVADYLVRSGTRYVFAYPGDPTIEMMERFRDRDIDVVLARREGTAAFMAEAYAMATGETGVCVSTLGPGSTALVNGVACATLDRVPMVAISGQIESSREQFFTHQVVDHGRLYAPVTKWAGRLEPGSVGTVMRKALRTATAERPGAVHLTATADATTSEARDALVRMPPREPAASTIDVITTERGADPAALLRSARRPVLLAGIGAVRGGATGGLVALAERAGVPVVVSPMAKGVFPEDHPYFAGVLDMACNALLWRFLGESDLIVAAGFDAVELIKPWSVATPVLHVDSTPNTDQVYAADVEVVGDIGAALRWLAEDWTGQPRRTEAEVSAYRAELRAAYYHGRTDGALNPTDVVDEVAAAAPEGAVAVSDVGSHKLLVGQGWRTREPRGCLMTNGLSAMGLGVPGTIAAKLARPDRAVIGMVGDGGFAMTATELRLASALGLGIAVVVFVDGSLNRIELKQRAQRYASTATRLEYTNLVTLAESMECDGVRVDSPSALGKALVGLDALSRPLVVEAHVDPAQYESQF